RIQNARVEVFDGTSGVFKNATTTDEYGGFRLNGLSPGDYVIRVVASSVASSRPGYNAASQLAVPTFRIDEANNIITPITNEVGGHMPSAPDAGNAGTGSKLNLNTFQFVSGPSGYAQDGTVIHLPSGTTVVDNVNFGFNFDVVCNTNDSGYGS